MSFHYPEFSKVVHASPKPKEVIDGMDELLITIRDYYSETYTWVRNRFQNEVPSSWN